MSHLTTTHHKYVTFSVTKPNFSIETYIFKNISSFQWNKTLLENIWVYLFSKFTVSLSFLIVWGALISNFIMFIISNLVWTKLIWRFRFLFVAWAWVAGSCVKGLDGWKYAKIPRKTVWMSMLHAFCFSFTLLLTLSEEWGKHKLGI